MDDWPRIVLVVGVPGAGKTTVAQALAQRFPRSACIESDHVQHGFTTRGLVPPGEPGDEAERQLELRWTNCAALAVNFQRAGFVAVVEGAVSVHRWIELFGRLTAPGPLSLIVLAPTLEVALARDRARQDKHVAAAFAHMDAELRQELAGLGYWLDTSELTVTESVDAIVRDGLECGAMRT